MWLLTLSAVGDPSGAGIGRGIGPQCRLLASRL